jgi:hypothetical protein
VDGGEYVDLRETEKWTVEIMLTYEEAYNRRLEKLP